MQSPHGRNKDTRFVFLTRPSLGDGRKDIHGLSITQLSDKREFIDLSKLLERRVKETG
jgi:hypothetical protein